MFTVGIFAASCALILATAPGEGVFTHHAPAKKLHVARIDSVGGDVRIRAIRGDEVSVTGTKTLGGASCSVTTRIERGSYIVAVKDGQAAPCRIDLVVSLPAQLKLEVDAQEGDVFVSGMHNAVTANLGHGSAVMGGDFPQFTAQIAEGSLSVQGLSGHALIELHHGNVQMWYGPKPHGTTSLDIEHGNVTITAPVKAVAVNTTLEAGTCSTTLENKPDAPLKLAGRIGKGNLVVRSGASR